jgi:hypothetical protein
MLRRSRVARFLLENLQETETRPNGAKADLGRISLDSEPGNGENHPCWNEAAAQIATESI